MADKKSKTIPCKSCEQEVAKSAKKCPNCGQQLKTGLFTKFVLVVVVMSVIGVIATPSDQELLQELDQAEISDLSPFGELNAAFSLMSDYTDVQRQNLESQIKGLTVEWELAVYEVSSLGEGKYRIQTHGSTAVGTFIELHTRSAEEIQYVEGLQLNDLISFKGTVEGTFLRHVSIAPAVLN